jgi:hypothetical protein
MGDRNYCRVLKYESFVCVDPKDSCAFAARVNWRSFSASSASAIVYFQTVLLGRRDYFDIGTIARWMLSSHIHGGLTCPGHTTNGTQALTILAAMAREMLLELLAVSELHKPEIRSLCLGSGDYFQLACSRLQNGFQTPAPSFVSQRHTPKFGM